MPKVDLEKWLALLAQPGAFRRRLAAAQPAAAGKAPALPPTEAARPLSPFPAEMDVSLALDVAEVVYRKGTVRDLAVAVEIHKGVITVPQLKAVLPGDMARAGDAASQPPASGEAAQPSTGTASCARRWHGSRSIASGVPADKLQQLDLKGKLAATANSVQVADVVGRPRRPARDGQRQRDLRHAA